MADGVLNGREAECAAVDRLIAGARDHHGAVLVIRGDAGMGKSAVLRHAVSHAADMTVLHATGVEAERRLPYAAVHQLLRPVIDRTDGAPAPQARALRAALGLEAGKHDRFLVFAGVLSLLAEVAALRPLLVVVDDAQWLDRASTEALLFTARRLRAEPIAMVFGARDGESTWFDADGLPELRLEGLRASAAATLLNTHLPADVPSHIRQRLLEVAGGNPLALLEMPPALSTAQLKGRVTLPDPLPVSPSIDGAFLHRVHGLPAATKLLLLVASASDSGEVDVVLDAAAALGCGGEALAAAEAAGVVVIADGQWRFRHPLIRAAIHQRASGVQRRAAHTALADALDGQTDSDRRVWHRAAAAVGRDPQVADELERSARRAAERSGYATAATVLERAADLTPDPQHAARRLVAAANAAWNAGQPQRVRVLLDRATRLAGDAGTRADIQVLHGQRERAHGTASRAYDILIDAAERIAPTDQQRAVVALATAGIAAWGRNDGARLVHAADRIAAVDLDDDATPDTGAARLVRGLAHIVRGDWPAAVSQTVRAMSAAERAGGPYELCMAGAGALSVGDDQGSLRLLARAAAGARSQGAVTVLAGTLAAYALAEAWTGHVRSAKAHATEGLALARQTGHGSDRSLCEAALAWMHAMSGDHEACHGRALEAARSGLEQEVAPATALAAWARGLSALGAGRPDEAHAHLAELVHRDGGTSHPMVAIAATGDIVEAAVMADRPVAARQAIEMLEQFAAGTRQQWALAVAARCRGLTGGPDDAEPHFITALEHHVRGSRPFEHGRTLLSYGVWLRRQRRPMDARQHLRAAVQIFERIGAADWEDRCCGELRASGETVRRSNPAGLRTLTPQERQIVHTVRKGATNKQIAAELYLSPRTIDYHLRKVFVKLGLSSRAELITLAAHDPQVAPAA